MPDPAHSERPLADVARLALGPGGAAFVSIGALVSVYGYLSANILGVPRITFALAENGDFPAIFSAIHPRFRTPYVSILAFALLSWLLALLGTFTWNATLSAVARLLYYGLVCAALPVFRRKQPGAALFRLPGGTSFGVLGAGICLALITGSEPERIADPAGDGGGGAGQLAGGAQVAVGSRIGSTATSSLAKMVGVEGSLPCFVCRGPMFCGRKPTVHLVERSFDFVAASRREAATALRMTH